MIHSSMAKSMKRFKIRKFGMIFLFLFLMAGNIVTLNQSFNGELFLILNGILCLVRFLIYGQLAVIRVRGEGPYSKLILAIIIIEIISFAPQLMLDCEILELTKGILYYLLLDAFSQVLVIFLLIDEFIYIQSLTEDISTYHKLLDNEKEEL